MKDLALGIFLGFFLGLCVGITQYYLGEGRASQAAREAQLQATRTQQAQVDMLKQMCPEVLQKITAEGKK